MFLNVNECTLEITLVEKRKCIIKIHIRNQVKVLALCQGSW